MVVASGSILYLKKVFTGSFLTLNHIMKTKTSLCPSTTPPQTVSVLEERLTLTEDKLKECLQHQSHIIKEIGQPGPKRRTATEGHLSG